MSGHYQETFYSRRPPAWNSALCIPSEPLPEQQSFVLALGHLAAGSRFLPCLSGDTIEGYQFGLQADNGETLYLPPVGRYTNARPTQKNDWAKSRIDWVALNEELKTASLAVDLRGQVDSNTLLHCSVRTQDDITNTPVDLASKRVLEVPPLSQMTYAEEIRKSICAPISILMVLAWYSIHPEHSAFIAAARHGPSGLYGLWPNNMLAASHAKVTATARYFGSLAEIVRLLDRNIPVPVSIRYASDDLPTAPLPESRGHLVVITGIQDNRVHVNDPAAPTIDTVPRTYPLDAFNRAWQHHHRIGYLLEPLREQA